MSPKQISIFEYAEEIKPTEPPCYTCVHAIKRGHFRLCSVGRSGYKRIGIYNACKKWKEPGEADK